MMEGTVPSDWQIGIIVPIYKKGDSRNCQNYRGITLGSVPGKMYAGILETRIREQIDNTIEESPSLGNKEAHRI